MVGGYPSPVPSHVRYANFGQRFGALLIDGIIMVLLAVPFALAVVPFWETEWQDCTINGRSARCNNPVDKTIIAMLVLGGLWYLSILLYQLYFVATSGQTPGRKALNIKVVGLRTGLPIGWGRTLGRFLMASFVSGNVCWLGYLWHLWDDQKQTWHDKVADSIVIQT